MDENRIIMKVKSRSTKAQLIKVVVCSVAGFIAEKAIEIGYDKATTKIKTKPTETQQ